MLYLSASYILMQADQVTVKIPADFQLEEDLPTVMSQLSTFIYKHGEERSKARAMLCCIFFEAIHDNFYNVSALTAPDLEMLYCKASGFNQATVTVLAEYARISCDFNMACS